MRAIFSATLLYTPVALLSSFKGADDIDPQTLTSTISIPLDSQLMQMLQMVKESTKDMDGGSLWAESADGDDSQQDSVSIKLNAQLLQTVEEAITKKKHTTHLLQAEVKNQVEVTLDDKNQPLELLVRKSALKQ